LAKASDIETLEPALRIGAARGVLQAAQSIIRERHLDDDIDHITLKVISIFRNTKTR